MGVIAIRASDEFENKIKNMAMQEKTNVSNLCRAILENNINIENPLKVIPNNWSYISQRINDLPQDISPDEYREIKDEIERYHQTIKQLWSEKVNKALDLLETKLSNENKEKLISPLDRLGL